MDSIVWRAIIIYCFCPALEVAKFYNPAADSQKGFEKQPILGCVHCTGKISKQTTVEKTDRFS